MKDPNNTFPAMASKTGGNPRGRRHSWERPSHTSCIFPLPAYTRHAYHLASSVAAADGLAQTARADSRPHNTSPLIERSTHDRTFPQWKWTGPQGFQRGRQCPAGRSYHAQGHPVEDNQNLRTVGNRGPTTMENYQFLEKITHFDRERIPERVVHARGAGRMGSLKPMAWWAMSRSPSTRAPRSLPARGSRRRSLCDSPA